MNTNQRMNEHECEHWNITLMVRDGERKRKENHIFYDDVYQETYTTEAHEDDRAVEIWCDDCETLLAWDEETVPEWVQAKVAEAENGRI